MCCLPLPPPQRAPALVIPRPDNLPLSPPAASAIPVRRLLSPGQAQGDLPGPACTPAQVNSVESLADIDQSSNSPPSPSEYEPGHKVAISAQDAWVCLLLRPPHHVCADVSTRRVPKSVRQWVFLGGRGGEGQFHFNPARPRFPSNRCCIRQNLPCNRFCSGWCPLSTALSSVEDPLQRLFPSGAPLHQRSRGTRQNGHEGYSIHSTLLPRRAASLRHGHRLLP